MAHIAERLGQIPSWEGIGGKSLMYKGQSGDYPWIHKVLIIKANIFRHQKPFEDYNFGRKTWNIEKLAFRQFGSVDSMFGNLSGYE